VVSGLFDVHLSETRMAVVGAIVRAAFTTGILLLLIGVINVQQTPFFMIFLAAFFVLRAAEISSPHAAVLQATIHGEDESRITTWILSTSIITNIVIPILQYRYASHESALGWMSWLGLFAFVLGSVLRIWSIRVAGESFKGQIVVTEKQRLVTSGPYAWVRHPSYLGVIIAYAGVAGIFSSSAGLAALLILVTPALIVRLLKEEKLLAGHFGDAWQQYTSKTSSMLMPGL
jgi:protein-S-isoprenylcysteine O-methyltransferase Ste14